VIRGRPRKFNKMAFLKELQAGHSRKQACIQLKVSYGTLEYHMRHDKYFRGKIYSAERKAREEKISSKREELDELFKKDLGYDLSYLDESMKRVSNGEISDEDAARDAIHITQRHRHILVTKQVPVLSVSSVDVDPNSMTWGELKKAATIEYVEMECIDFDAYLKDLARRNPKKWGPAIRVIREWYKWRPEMQEFFMRIFIMDHITFRWMLDGPPSLWHLPCACLCGWKI
jgi:hypothetical protein